MSYKSTNQPRCWTRPIPKPKDGKQSRNNSSRFTVPVERAGPGRWQMVNYTGGKVRSRGTGSQPRGTGRHRRGDFDVLEETEDGVDDDDRWPAEGVYRRNGAGAGAGLGGVGEDPHGEGDDGEDVAGENEGDGGEGAGQDATAAEGAEGART